MPRMPIANVDRCMTVRAEATNASSSSAIAERPRELDQRFQLRGKFKAIQDWRVTFRVIATWRNLRLRIIW